MIFSLFFLFLSDRKIIKTEAVVPVLLHVVFLAGTIVVLFDRMEFCLVCGLRHDLADICHVSERLPCRGV